MFSARTCWPREPNRLALARQRARGPILDLTESNPTQVGLGPDPTAIAEALAQGALAPYQPEPFGLLQARIAVSAYYAARGLQLDPDDIAMVASTSEAYAHTFRLLADPGDDVLIPSPSYPLFDFLASLQDVRLVPYPLRDSGDRWSTNDSAIVAALTPRTRGLVVVSPNNPTGSVPNPSERAALLDIAHHHDLGLLADEVFLDYADAPFARTSFAGASEALSFTFSGLSKVGLMPHLKLGWIIVGGPNATKKEAKARLELILDTYLSPATPVQAALPALLSLATGAQETLRARVAQNRAALGALGLRVRPSDGGWYAILDLPEPHDDETWALGLLDHGVYVQPGYFFELPGSSVVVSLITPPSTFAEALNRLVEYVQGEARGMPVNGA